MSLQPSKSELSTIRIKGLPRSFVHIPLRHYFSQFGSIKKVKTWNIPNSYKIRTTAYIMYKSPEGAQKAIAKNHGSMISGKVIRCKLVSEKDLKRVFSLKKTPEKKTPEKKTKLSLEERRQKAINLLKNTPEYKKLAKLLLT